MKSKLNKIINILDYIIMSPSIFLLFVLVVILWINSILRLPLYLYRHWGYEPLTGWFKDNIYMSKELLDL